MAEPNPTNQRLADLLHEVAQEVRELKDQQRELAAEVRQLAESSPS